MHKTIIKSFQGSIIGRFNTEDDMKGLGFYGFSPKVLIATGYDMSEVIVDVYISENFVSDLNIIKSALINYDQ